MINNELLSRAESASFALRSLYKQYGYLPFRMSKFEEYDLYAKNKEFLISENVITFNDTDGRLLALKPDVTLSIIKNSAHTVGEKQKVYYNENVYRISPKVHKFKEIMQAGLECIGDTDIMDTFEAVELAAKSLELISEDYVLDVSHLGILSRVLSYSSENKQFGERAIGLLAEKNRHELSSLCESYGVSDPARETVLEFVDMYGEPSEVLERLLPICKRVGAEELFSELKLLCTLIADTGYASKIELDFSVVNNMKYYNGIVFKGFIKGIPDGVLAGGEYGNLMQRMGKDAGAVGFAIYLDMLDELSAKSREYDVDVLLLYGDTTDPKTLAHKRAELISEGRSVSAMKAVPEKLRYKEIIKLDK